MRLAVLAVALLNACATTLDPNYALQLESYRLTITAQQNVELAKAKADEARYIALAEIAQRAGPQSQQLAILALALGGRGAVDARALEVALPRIPESQEDRALKWAAIFAGPVTSVATGYFGYKLGVAQSNNTASSTIASYSAVSNGYAANQGIAVAGFNAADRIAGAGFGAAQGIAGAGFGANTRPNITLTNGNLGTGAWTGPNSGSNSGNSGRIDSPNRNCSGTGTSSSSGDGATGSGGVVTPGNC